MKSYKLELGAELEKYLLMLIKSDNVFIIPSMKLLEVNVYTFNNYLEIADITQTCPRQTRSYGTIDMETMSPQQAGDALGFQDAEYPMAEARHGQRPALSMKKIWSLLAGIVPNGPLENYKGLT